MRPTTLQIALFVCGLLGSGLKAWASQSQGTLSRRSVADIVTGGVIAVLVPIYIPALLPAGQNVFAQAMIIFALSYFSSDFVTNMLVKLGVKGIDPGAAKVLAWCLVAGTLAGCASSPGADDRVAALRAFALRDFSTARDIATAGGDKAGAQCLTYLAAQAAALAATPPTPLVLPDPSLPIAALERIRVAIHARSVGASLLEDLDLHCAALRTSLEIDLAKGALLGASVAGSGGATAPAAIKKILPILLRLLRPASGGG